MSKAALHGVVQTLREYLEYELSLDDDLGFSLDEPLNDAWTTYQRECDQRMLEEVRKSIAAPDTPTDRQMAHQQMAHQGANRRSGPPSGGGYPSAGSSNRQQNQWDSGHSRQAMSSVADTPSEESELWRTIGAVTRKDLNPPPPSVPQAPPSPQRRPTHSDRRINRDRAVAAHRLMESRGPFGWINGTWHNPVEPPEGFSKDEKLHTIRVFLQQCRRCRLCESRTKVVCDDGSPDGRVMFIGEGPGAQEDRTGIPFVGAAGELLSGMIGAMKLDRQRDVYIANIVKCRPPNNRDPDPEEISRCIGFLKRQIEAVQPEVIVLLGRVAFSALLPDAGGSITRSRGKWFEYHTSEGRVIPVMPTFHPAYLLHAAERNKTAKGQVWSDLQQVMSRLGIET